MWAAGKRFTHSSLRPPSPSGTLTLMVSLAPCIYPRPYPNSPADKTQHEESNQKKVISAIGGPQLRAEAILVRPQRPSVVRTEIKAVNQHRSGTPPRIGLNSLIH